MANERCFCLTITGEPLCFNEAETEEMEETLEWIWAFLQDLFDGKYAVGQIENIDYDNRVDGEEALWEGFDRPPDSVIRVVIREGSIDRGDWSRWDTKSFGLWEKEQSE
ncbi:MAG: hypothetical protein DRN20_03445 [Thermoplasmata archaeon]|nr:MAG: hypothetical protein DRN20_03445 [Thermoplasmata archaeon]